MEYEFMLANGLPAVIHWLADKRMLKVAEACRKHVMIGVNAYAAIEVAVKNETVYLVGICSPQTPLGAKDLALFWSKDPEAVDRACLLVYNGTCYRLDQSGRGRMIMAGLKRRTPPSISILVGEDADDG